MARSETLTTRLTVDDDASKPTEEFAKKLDKLDGETVTVALALKAAEVQGQLEDALAEAAKLDASDPTIDVKVAHAAELKSELDSITAEIDRINATPVELDTRPAVEGVKKVGTEADNSRSVLANMVGNSTQDLGELGGIAGSAGVAIGQLGEYATEGNISLMGLASVAGPMLGLAAAAQLVSMGMESLAKARELDKQKTDAWVKSLEEGADAATALADRLREAGEVKVVTKGLFGNDWFSRIDEAKFAIFNAGLTFDTFAETVAGGREAIDKWAAQAKAAGKRGEDIEFTLKAMNEELAASERAWNESQGMIGLNTRSLGSLQAALEDMAEAEQIVQRMPADFSNIANALETVRAGGQVTQEQLDSLNAIMAETGLTTEEVFAKTQEALDAHNAKLAENTAALEVNAQAHTDNAAALDASVLSFRAAADAQLALNDATGDFAAKTAALPETLKDAKGNLHEVRAALDDVTQSAAGVADATVRVSEEQAAANGVTLTSKQKLDQWNKSMLTQADTLEGPARDAILEYVGAVNGIEAEKLTDVKAALDTGSVSDAQKALDDVSIARETAIEAEAETAEADRQLDAVAAQKRTAIITAKIVADPPPAFKLVPVSGTTSSGTRSAAPAAQRVIINLPRGARAADITQALSKHARRAGTGYSRGIVHYARR